MSIQSAKVGYTLVKMHTIYVLKCSYFEMVGDTVLLKQFLRKHKHGIKHMFLCHSKSAVLTVIKLMIALFDSNLVLDCAYETRHQTVV